MESSVGVMPSGEWVRIRADAHDVSATTWAEYDPRLRNHVLPRFRDVPLKAISRLAAKGWVKTLRRSPAERCSPVDAVLVVTTAYTCLRWSELAGGRGWTWPAG
ncbi:hypothetical protein ACFXGA_09655 [Actinosynnema sp. NPDC059335]|uniref:hypothetical protein n=1 Tax=Actinosynnema sp. NPDC059335 TaxID=3346804 RepID=UPI00367048B4